MNIEKPVTKGKLRVLGNGRIAFYCPGCKEFHAINTEGENRPVWGFNGNYDNPTFTPSVLIT